MEYNKINFDSIDDFYKKIESDSYNMDKSVCISIRALFEKTDDITIKSRIQAEHYVFSFIIKNGEVAPQFSTAYENGCIWSFPSYDDFNGDFYDYISSRAKVVHNPYLRIRYNQIIWCSPLTPKNNQASKLIVDTSLAILSSVNSNTTEEEYLRWFEAIINGLRISIKIKYQADSYVKALIQCSKTKKLDYQYKYLIIDSLSDYPKYLVLYYDEIRRIQNAQIRKANQENNISILRSMFATGLAIAQKTNAKVNPWHERIGDLYVREAEKRMDDETKMMPLKFYKDAILHYQLAGVKKKIKDIEKRYAELKKNLKLNTVEIPIDIESIKAVKEDIDARIKPLFHLESKYIYQYLANNGEILPDLAVIGAASKKSGNTFSDYFATLKFDINNNVREGAEKNKQEQRNELYRLYLNLYTLPFLHRVFIGGFVDQKINYETMIEHFYSNSWLGTGFQDSETNFGRQYNWVSLIAPSLFEYFKQTQFGIDSLSSPKTNYILAIDSLTIKFEGALRDFGKTVGIVPTVSGKKSVLREKYIEEILGEETLKKYFSDNEIFFFSYLFVSKDGFNLRNNIAHAFFKFNNYSYHLMHLVMLAFLRLSRYNIRTNY